MTTPIQGTSVPAIFNFESHDIRAFADEHGEPWFLAADVCEVLGYRNPSAAVSKHCREAGVTKRDISSGGQMREVTYINEGNLYRLIVKSRKPEAEKFERLVMEEILPSIRRTGEYRTPYTANPRDILSAAQAEQLRLLVQSECGKLPQDFRKPFSIQVWSKLKAHFGVTYRNIPQCEFTEALSLVGRHAASYPQISAPSETHARRWVLTWEDGAPRISPMLNDELVMAPSEIPAFLRNVGVSIPLAIDIIDACTAKLKVKLISTGTENWNPNES